MRHSDHKAGVTIAEVLIVILIIGAVYMMTALGVRLISNLHRQGTEMEVEREAQVVLYNLTKEIRASKYIISVSSDVIKLRSHDLRNGYDSDVNPAMFLDSTMGTITYRHVTDGQSSSLQRTVEYTGVTRTESFLKNIISTSATGADFIFLNIDPQTTSCPCYEVQIRFQMNRGWFKDKNPRQYDTQVTVRSTTQ